MRADQRRTPRGSLPARAPRATGRPAAALALALAPGALLLLALAAFSVGAPPSAHGQALHAQAASPVATLTPTATATPTSTPGTITLVSPSYGSGPAGAHVTVSGSGFSGASLTLDAASHADCTSPQATLDHVALTGGSFSNHTFIWPSTLPNGSYYICATGTTSGPAYQQLATAAPAISLSAPSVAQEGQLVISGSNFVGLSAGSNIQLTAQQGNAKPTITPGVVDANGDFTDPWTVDLSFTGTVVIVAQSPPEGTSPAVLQASASVTILPPATATPSATVSTTPTTSGAGAGVSTPGNSGSNGGGGLILVIVLLIVALLVGGGALTFVLLRRGGAGGPPAPYPPGGAYPGYSGGYSPYGPASPSGWDATTGRMSSAGLPGQYGGPGTGAYQAPGGYAVPGVGGVSQWDEPTEEFSDEPGPSWQPRPMTGYGDFRLPQETAPSGGEYAPPDPWGDPAGGYGEYGSGQGGNGGYGAGDRGAWRNQEGGPGATRPDGGPAGQYPRYPGQGYDQAPGAGWPDDTVPGGGRPPDDWRQ